MIYLDNSATTMMNRKLIEVIERYSCERYFNPSALYKEGLNVKMAMTESRVNILRMLSASGYDLTFTASGSESNNTFILGARLPKGSRILISSMEHPSVYNPAMLLAQRGYEVVIVNCDSHGKVDIDDFISKLTPTTSLVSIMQVSNETGAINDILVLAKHLKTVNAKGLFHCDGVQAIGKMPVKISQLGVDAYTFSAHKFHGMKGVGGLIVRRNVGFSPLILGGGQEGNLRSSTENVAGIVTTAMALEDTLLNVKELDYRTKIIEFIKKLEPNVIVSSPITGGVSKILSISLPNTRGEVILHTLEDCGIIIGTGSACSSHKGNNRIATALSLPKSHSMGMLRFSMSDYTKGDDIDKFLRQFNMAYNQYKQMTRS